MIKRLLFFSLLFLVFVSFGQEETEQPSNPSILNYLQLINDNLDEISDGYYYNWQDAYFDTALTYFQTFDQYFSNFQYQLDNIYYWMFSDIANNQLEVNQTLSSLYTDFQSYKTDFSTHSSEVLTYLKGYQDELLEITDGYYYNWQGFFQSLDENVQAILQELEGNEDRENTNASNIQSIKDTLENFAPSFDSMVSSLANIESNTSYGDINYNNEDLIKYLNDNHFDDFYTTFHGYSDAFVPTYLGYMSWNSFSISGNKDSDTLRSWLSESIAYDNFFIQVCQYLDNLANMSANANKSLMMIFDSIKSVDTTEEKNFIENQIADIEAQESKLRDAFNDFNVLQENIKFEKFEEYVKTGSEGKVNLEYIIKPGNFYDELDLGFFPTEWNNRPINVGNLYVRLGVLHEYLLVCRDIFAVVYIFLITVFILWIVGKMLPILSKLLTTLKAVVVWK